MSIKRSSIENLKSRVNLVDVAGKYTALKKRGKSYVGLSPFTQEKTPSFHIDPIKNVFYCFSSNQGGDLIGFVQGMEKLEFYEAVESLAEKYGIPLEYEEGTNAPKQDKNLKKELHEIHLYAAEFYQKAFAADHPEAEAVRKYWTQERKFPLTVAKEFGVGYAPANPHKLLETLIRREFSPEAISQSGLYFNAYDIKEFSSYKPRFRGRLMIPLRDAQGQVIAFTGRKLPQTPADDPAFEAKYVNSPETLIFKKGRMLFNFDRARMAVEKQGYFLMVEGQLDTLRVYTSGYGAVVAPQGTAITIEQLGMLKRYEPKLRVFLDGDRAGQAAALRVLPMALKEEIDISFLRLNPGVDPDAFFRDGGKIEELEQLSPMDFALKTYFPEEGHKMSAQAKSYAYRKVFDQILVCPSAITQEALLDELVKALKSDRRTVGYEFNKYKAEYRADNTSVSPPQEERISETADNSVFFNKNLTISENELLLVLVHFPQLAAKVAHALDTEWLDPQDENATLLNRILAEAAEGLWDPEKSIDKVAPADPQRSFLYGLLALEAPQDDPIDSINNCIYAIRKKHGEKMLAALREQIAGAADQASMRELLKKQQFYLNFKQKTPFLKNA
jgi:DNA primase